MKNEMHLPQTSKKFELSIFMFSTLVLLLGYCFVMVGIPAQISKFLLEDGIVENLGALAYLFAALGAFWQAYKISGCSKKWIWFALLGALFFLCAGEETSWGQRFLGLETPEGLKAHNAQGELNLHNLWIFHYSNQDGSAKTGLASFLVPTRLLTLFFVAYTIILPLICHFSSSAGAFCKRLCLPVPNWQPGVFIATLLVVDIATKKFGNGNSFRVNELKETYYGVCAILLLINLSGQLSSKAHSPQS